MFIFNWIKSWFLLDKEEQKLIKAGREFNKEQEKITRAMTERNISVWALNSKKGVEKGNDIKKRRAKNKKK